jgi:plasmid stability protein
MATLTIKNIPDELYRELKRTAGQHRRSLNSEVIVCLERSLQIAGSDASSILARARELRVRTVRPLLNDRRLSVARSIGRR